MNLFGNSTSNTLNQTGAGQTPDASKPTFGTSDLFSGATQTQQAGEHDSLASIASLVTVCRLQHTYHTSFRVIQQAG